MSFKVKVPNNDWSTSCIIGANIQLTEEPLFYLENATVLLIKNSFVQEEGVFIAKIFSPRKLNNNIMDAHYHALRKLDQLLQQFAVISYHPARILQTLSTTHYMVDFNEEFEMLIPIQYEHEKNAIEISNEDLMLRFSSEEINNSYLSAIRLLKEGISSENKESKYLSFYSALELIASIHSNDKLKTKCENCGFEVERGKATFNYIKQLLLEDKCSVNEAKTIRSLRGKIAHGSGKRDKSFVHDLEKFLPKIEKVAFKAIRDKTKIKIKSPIRSHGSDQFWKIKGVKVRKARWRKKTPFVFKVLSAQYTFKFSITDVNEEWSDMFNNENPIPEGFLTPHLYLNRKLPIHPQSWPY